MTTPLRDRWRNGDTTLGGWLATPSSVMAEATARAGFDYVCVDTQHGAIEYSDAVGLIQAILLGGSSPIVRVPWNEPGIIGKMLDAGAQGVIIPMVNTVVEAEAETRRAVEDIDAILAVPGIDAIYVGPADLSLTLGLPPGNNDDVPAFADAYTTIVDACRRAGVVAGCHANGALTPARLAAGFGMVTVTTDLVAARLGFAAELALARSDTDRPGSGAIGPY